MRDKKKTLDKENKNLKLKKRVKKQKLQERGITLIALVVTIIILLILAGVTLNIALSDNGLFNKTKKAAEEYKEAQSEEEDSLLKYEYEMAKLQGEIDETETVGEYAMEKQIKEKYGQDIKIGDTVNYDPNIEETEENTYDGTWKVLGIEDGQILLMSSKPVKTNFKLSGADGYLHGVEKLDEICKEFGNSELAEKARSLRAEDINRITGFNPNNSVNGDKYGKDYIGEYGTRVTFSLSDSIMTYKSSNGLDGSYECNKVWYLENSSIVETGFKEITLKNSVYKYNVRASFW